MYTKDTYRQICARVTLGFIIGLLLVFASAQLFLGVNWTEELNTIIDESLMMSEEIMEQFGSAAQIEDQMTQIREQMKNLTLLIRSEERRVGKDSRSIW